MVKTPASSAGGMALIPVSGTKIPQPQVAAKKGKLKKKKNSSHGIMLICSFHILNLFT